MSRCHIDVGLAGTQVRLLADKALYWPGEQLLLVADVHFGSLGGDGQLLRDLTICQALRDEHRHFPLALREHVRGPRSQFRQRA